MTGPQFQQYEVVPAVPVGRVRLLGRVDGRHRQADSPGGKYSEVVGAFR